MEDNNFASDLNKPALSRILWWAPRFSTSSSRVGGQYNQYARLWTWQTLLWLRVMLLKHGWPYRKLSGRTDPITREPLKQRVVFRLVTEEAEACGFSAERPSALRPSRKWILSKKQGAWKESPELSEGDVAHLTPWPLSQGDPEDNQAPHIQTSDLQKLWGNTFVLF